MTVGWITGATLSLGALALAGCATAPAPQTASAVPAAPFVVPMDPGQISCSSLSNPGAVAAATDWTMGRARGAVLAGRIAAVPDTSKVTETLTAYCAANPGDPVRAASAALGI